jgi:hypothetical protein
MPVMLSVAPPYGVGIIRYGGVDSEYMGAKSLLLSVRPKHVRIFFQGLERTTDVWQHENITTSDQADG